MKVKNQIFEKFSGLRLILLAVLCAGVLGLSGAQPAHAASIGCTVNDLITAIDNANANPDTTTIDLATNCTYTLTVPISDGSGFHGLEITTPVIINGNGATITRDSSAPIFRIFLVTSTGSLTVGNLAVSNGNMNSPWPSQPIGGGILNFGTVTVNNSTVSGNSAVSDNPVPESNDDGFGGGIYNSNILILNNSTVSGNSAAEGGGIFNTGTLNVTGSTFSSNTADNQGGGIFNSDSGTVTVTNSLVSSNTCRLSLGGGISNNAGTLNVVDSTFSNNVCPTGGALWNGGTLSVRGSTFSSNTASAYNGGGISNLGTATVENSTLSGNSANEGGGIASSGTLNVANSTFSNNTGYIDGGGLSVFICTAATVTNSTFHGNSADRGGGIANYCGPVTVTNSTLSGNSASSFGGGLAKLNNFATVVLYNTIAAGNTNGDCASGSFGADAFNIDSDGSCDNATTRTMAQLALGLLANNGGSTQTMALGAGSVAIDAGNNTAATNAGLTTDQRGTGFPRIRGATVDIGAFEACAAGTYDTGSGCVPADPGHYVAAAGATSQTPCAPGFYQPNSGSVSCIAAGPGHYVASSASSAQTACASGSYQPNAGAAACNLASPGYFVDTAGATTQTACPTGYTSNVGATSCTPLDAIAPTAAPTQSPAANGAGWNNSNVTVSWNWADNAGGSGIDPGNCITSSTSSSEGTLPLSATCKDNVGNTGNVSYTVKVDKTAPSVSCGAADGLWHASDVSIACTSGDGTSGLANGADADFNLTTSVASGTETSNASTNSRSVADQAGNSATAGPISGNKIDKKAPSISITAPTATTYALNQVVAANYSCSDGGADVASCAGTVASGANLNTTSVGPKTFTLNATDNAANTSSVNVNYTVAYNFSGFFQPVDNGSVLNVVKAGSAVPVKFSLGGNFGLNIMAANSPASGAVTCSSSEPPDAIEETVTAGGSSLSYDATTNQYTYVWKTDKAWANTCRQLHVKLTDGTDHVADFKFTK
jgi:hypothetical protein